MRSVRVLFILIVVCAFAAAAVLLGYEARSAPAPRDNPAPAQEPEVVPQPLRAVVGLDQSGSMDDARVAPVTVPGLAPIFSRLETSGGELAIAFITDQSNAPLLRMFIPEPPDVPVEHRRSRNVFDAAAEKKQYDQERNRYAAKYRAWRSDASARVNSFAVTLDQRLKRKENAPRTDIGSALARANLFLSEPISYKRSPKNLAIFVSDGIDNTNLAPAPAFSVPVDVLIVNGRGTIAYLTPLRPVQFESLEAALRFAVPEGGRDVR